MMSLLSVALLMLPAFAFASGTHTGEGEDFQCVIERHAEPALRVSVRLTFVGSSEGRTQLEVAESWGGVDGAGEDLLDLRVVDEDGHELVVIRDSVQRWTVQHPPGARLQVTYGIAANDNQSYIDPQHSRRVILNERIFRGIGHLFLLLPEHLDPSVARPIQLRWKGFEEAGGEAACSFGVGFEPEPFQAALDELRHAVYLAGSIELCERDILGESVYLAMDSSGFPFEADDFADVVAGIIEAERTFFDDFDQPFYLVTLIPTGEARSGSLSFGGTGLANAFALSIRTGTSLEPEGKSALPILKLLAHEMFHDWNGILLQRTQPEALALWFSEGFTDFYARRLLLRGGFITLEQYVGLLNETLTKLYTSPVRNEPNERILADFWRDSAVKDLPYLRGDVVALLVDRAIRHHSDGRESLDDLLRELVERARNDGTRVSTESLLEDIAKRTSEEFAAEIAAIVVEGAIPEVPEDCFAPALHLLRRPTGSFAVGFDLNGSQAERRVLGVDPEGPAHAAGLRDGQQLVGWSVHHGDTTRNVELTIREEGLQRVIRYLPIGATFEVPQFEIVAGVDAVEASGL